MKAYVYETADGTAEVYIDRKRAFWSLSVLYALFPFQGIALHAWTGNELTLLVPIFLTYGVGPLVDFLLGEDPSNPPDPIRPCPKVRPFPSPATSYPTSPEQHFGGTVRPGVGRLADIQPSDEAERPARLQIYAAMTSAPQSTRLFDLCIRVQRPVSIPWASTTRQNFLSFKWIHC